MDELNQNVPAENAEQEHAMKCENNEANQKAKTPALFKAGIALMCATSALSLGAIGACGFLGYKLYKNSKNNKDSKPEDSMGSVVTNKNDSISISSDGYWVINGVKTNTKAITISPDGYWVINGVKTNTKAEASDGVSVVSASVVKLDKWGITTQILFTMSDNSYLTTAPQTQVLNDHYYEASSMSDVMTLVQGYKVSKIKLTSNINLSSSVEFEGSTTFDLNKKTLTYSGTRALEVADESILTFKNGSLVLQSDVGVSINGANSELAFEKVNISATEVVAETLEENASINLDNCTFTVAQPTRMMFSAGQNSGVGSLFVVKGSNASLAIKGSKFETSRAIVSASENAESINLKIQETKLTTSAPILDINTEEVIPTLDVDQDTIKNSTITELNTTPITSGTFNVDPTELGAELAGETFNVNGSSVIAADLADLISKVESGSTINLTRDYVLESNIVITKTLTLNLGSYTISAPHNADLAVLQVEGEGKLTINATVDGGINSASDSNSCSIAVWARNGGEAIINGGFYTNLGALSNLGNNKFANNEMIYTSGNGSKITINDGYFMGNYENEKWGTRYTLNKHDSTNSEIIVNGGLFYMFNPEASLSENPVANFVAEGKIVVSDGETYMVTSADMFEELVNIEEVNYVSIHSDIVLERGFVVENRELTLNLNSYTISAPTSASTALIRVNTNGFLTIEGNGTINSASNANDYSIAVWASNGGQVAINGGTFTNVGAKDFEDNGTTPNNNELIYVSGSGSLITINNATIIGNSENETWGTRYTLNKADRCNSDIVVNGGTFVNYDPSMSKSENPIANFVAEGKLVYKVGDNYTVAPVSELVNIIKNNKGSNIMLPIAYVVDSELTIDLNDCTISLPTDTDGSGVFKVVEGGNLTINGNGTINGVGKNDYNMAIWVYGGKATINGGTYTNKGATASEDPAHFDLLYVRGGELIINGGTFINETPQWTLNLRDDTPGTIIVNGGTFVGYNPAESHTENPVANFVAEGKFVVEKDGNYTVVSSVEEVNNFVTTGTLLVKNGIVYSVVTGNLNTVVANAQAGSTVILTENIVLDEGIALNKELTLNLNTYTISAPHSASTSLFKVELGGVLTINGEGMINSASDSNDYSMAVWARNGGQVIINGGTFTNVGGKDFEDNGTTPNNNELIYVSGSGSLITINNATIIGNSENETWGTRYTLNKADGCNSSIVVNGGTFVKYDPSMSKSENPIANFVAEGKFVYKVGNNYSVASLENLVDVINNNAGADIMLPTAYVVNTTLTINLNGCTISTPNDTVGDGVFHVVEGGILTINGEGTINGVGAGDYHMAIWVHGGKVTINGGTFTNVGATESGEPADQFDLMYVKGGELVINGGTFTSETPKWTLNLNDKIAGTITVCGGTFLGYNPTESHSENPVANFIAEGYKVVVDGNTYTVVAE